MRGSERAGAISRNGSAGTETCSPGPEGFREDFRAFVLDRDFPCVGAKAAIRTEDYRAELYGRLGSPEAAAGLARDLRLFVREQGELGDFTTFVAGFEAPEIRDEAEFERLLWAQLQALHEEDRGHRWDPSVSSDPESPDFAFSFAGRAFFVVGLNPANSRLARRFAWPALVFNAHYQFDKLREDGRYERMQGEIRARERALQGSLNPNLSEFGERSEARQYSGRPAEEGWRCPFHAAGERENGAREES